MPPKDAPIMMFSLGATQVKGPGYSGRGDGVRVSLVVRFNSPTGNV